MNITKNLYWKSHLTIKIFTFIRVGSYSNIFSTIYKSLSIFYGGIGNVKWGTGLKSKEFKKYLEIFYTFSLGLPTDVFPMSLLCSVGSMSIWIFLISDYSLKLATIASGQILMDLLVWIFLLKIYCWDSF